MPTTNNSQDSTVKITLTRDLSLFDITMIGVGAMIGAGIFVLTGSAAHHAGPALLLAFLLNGLVALLTAASYAELGPLSPGRAGAICGRERVSPPTLAFWPDGCPGSPSPWRAASTRWALAPSPLVS